MRSSVRRLRPRRGGVRGSDDHVELELHLGSRASGPSDVTLRSVSLTNADRSITVVDAVGALPSPPFPVTVAVDSDQLVSLTISADDNQLEAAAVETLCGLGDLVYVVVLDDSLRGGTVTAVSEPVTPSGCP